MSLNGNPIGTWHPGPPLSSIDKAKLYAIPFAVCVAIFGLWWVWS